MGYIKVFAQWQQQQQEWFSDHNSSIFFFETDELINISMYTKQWILNKFGAQEIIKVQKCHI